ncbi:MAG: ABC transporter ATP-binding protein [Pseudomonadota bacterium]
MALTAKGITKYYGPNRVLNQVDLEIRPGEFVALLGPSGSGKTSLLRIIAGLQFPEEGQILFDSTDITGLEAGKRQFGMVFQSYALFEHMTVADNVAFGLKVRGRHQRPSRSNIDARVRELLEMAGIGSLSDRFPGQLSGGQRQRVALSRALAIDPRLLLLDEPFSALDSKIRKDLRSALRNIQKEVGITAILVTHDQEEAFDLADRIAIMSDGKIEQFDTPETLLRHPKSEFVADFLDGIDSFQHQGAGI